MFGRHKHRTLQLQDFRSECSYCGDIGFPISDNVIRCVGCNVVWAHYEPDF